MRTGAWIYEHMNLLPKNEVSRWIKTILPSALLVTKYDCTILSSQHPKSNKNVLFSAQKAIISHRAGHNFAGEN